MSGRGHRRLRLCSKKNYERVKVMSYELKVMSYIMFVVMNNVM